MKFYLKNVLLIIRCLTAATIRGKANQRVKLMRRVVIVQPAKLGDMVCTTPVFAALKKHLPDIQVVVMGNQANQDLLLGQTDVDGYLVISSVFSDNLKMLKSAKADVIILITPSLELLSAAYLSGAPLVIGPMVTNGWSPYQSRGYRLLSHLVSTVPHQMNFYAPQEYLNLLKPLGVVSTDTTKKLTLSPVVEERVSKLLANVVPNSYPKLVGIAPGVGNKIKLWPPERFAQVADHLIVNHKVFVLIIGGVVDTKEVIDMARLITSHSGWVTFKQTLSLEELKALISKLDLFISVDTGPIYIAEAFKIPTIDIVGPMSEEEQPPRGPLNEVVVASRDEPVIHIMNARLYDKVEARRQVENISAQSVCQVVDRLMSKINHESR